MLLFRHRTALIRIRKRKQPSSIRQVNGVIEAIVQILLIIDNHGAGNIAELPFIGQAGPARNLDHAGQRHQHH
jgi:hypothetical protein